MSAQAKAIQDTLTLNSWKSHRTFPLDRDVSCDVIYRITKSKYKEIRKPKLFAYLFKKWSSFNIILFGVPYTVFRKRWTRNTMVGELSKTSNKKCSYPRGLVIGGCKLFQYSEADYKERKHTAWDGLCSQHALCNKWVFRITLKGERKEVWHNGPNPASSLHATLAHTESPQARVHWFETSCREGFQKQIMQSH